MLGAEVLGRYTRKVLSLRTRWDVRRLRTSPRSGAIGSALALVVVASFAGASGGLASSHEERECTDYAQPIGGTRADEGEPSLKMPQRSPRRLVATWTRDTSVERPVDVIQGQIVLAQRDPGGAWSEEVLADLGADSWIDTSPNGAAYVSYIDWNRFPAVRRVVPGHPAGPPHLAPAGDHPAVAVDQALSSSSPHGRDRLYLVSSYPIGFSPPLAPGMLVVSNDGGLSWSRRVDFPPHLPGFLDVQLAPVVASGGSSVVAAWLEQKEGSAGEEGVAIRAAPIDPRTGAFGSPTTLAMMPGVWSGLPFAASTLPSVSVVRGGAHEGRTYVVWPQRRGGWLSDVSDVMVSYSDDRGRTWSRAQQVNDDQGSSNYHVYPSVAASSGGDAFVVWMDSRDDPTGATGLMYGARVGANGRIGRNVRLTGCPSWGWSSLGDYFNFDASAGEPAVIFSNQREGHGDSDAFALLAARHETWLPR